MRVAAQVILTDEQRAQLQAYARGRKTSARLVLRARIILLASEGKPDLEIARLLSVVPSTPARWRARLLRAGIAGLQQDARRPGRPRSITAETEARVIRQTTQSKPPHATHWSTRSMAAAVGISEASVRRIWHAHGLKPHRVQTFKLSHDPQFAEKLEDIVGFVPKSAGARSGAVPGREKPNPSVGPHPTWVADEAGPRPDPDS